MAFRKVAMNVPEKLPDSMSRNCYHSLECNPLQLESTGFQLVVQVPVHKFWLTKN